MSNHRTKIFTLGALFASFICRCAVGQPAAPNNNGATFAQPAQQDLVYAIDDLVLGEKIRTDSSRYAEFSCNRSEQSTYLTWCQKKEVRGHSRQGDFVSSYSIAHDQNGIIVYASRSIDQDYLTSSDARSHALGEIAKLSDRFHQKERLIWIPHRERLPTALIAYWGEVKPEPLPPKTVGMIRAGRDIREGVLMDFLGDFKKSARLELPIYRLTGGSGYLYSANFNQQGHAYMRNSAIDPSSFFSVSSGNMEKSPSQPVFGRDGSNEIGELGDRKLRLRDLAADHFRDMVLYEYLIRKAELSTLSADTPVVRIVFKERVFFDTAKWDVRSDAVQVIDLIANSLKNEPPATELWVVGHTDDRGNDAYNRELSEKRANSVAEAILRRLPQGLSPLSQIRRIGFGKTIALRPNDSPENMAINRRVEFIMGNSEAVAYWLRNTRHFLCPPGSNEFPELCKESSSSGESFEAQPVNLPPVMSKAPPNSPSVDLPGVPASIIITLEPPPTTIINGPLPR